MTRKSLWLAALVTLAPAALLAADPSPRFAGPRGDGEWFKRLDANQDGVITQDEANAASAERVAKSFERFDADKDGMITQDEVRVASEARVEERKAVLAERIKSADKNGDGLLSKEEVTAGMPRLANHFDQMDTNKDGQISTDELASGRKFGHRKGHGGPAPQ
jgi:Ca2+-binding EF-hand superfamily protein